MCVCSFFQIFATGPGIFRLNYFVILSDLILDHPVEVEIVENPTVDVIKEFVQKKDIEDIVFYED